MEMNLILPPVPGLSAQSARRVEELGFDGLFLSDSQNLVPEVWGQLLLSAGTTDSIALGPGVTNPVTRDAAVAASSALALQQESGGRAVFAIGRGDSAVRWAGLRPASLANFEAYLIQLRAYLSGGSVERAGLQSEIRWPRALGMELPPVPIEVAATGPRVIELAARRADRISFAVGADPQYLASKLDFARDAVERAGRSGKVRLGAYINAVVHPDLAVAQQALRGAAATFAHFSSFAPDAGQPAILREAARYLGEHYKLDDHAQSGVSHADGLSEEFVDWFGIAGPPDRARPRFEQLAALGLDYLTVVIGYTGFPLEVGAEAMRLLAEEIRPGLAGHAPSSHGAGTAVA